MKRSILLRAAPFTLALAMGLSMARPAFADPVDVLYEEGVTAAQAGQKEIAYEKLKAAWALRQTYDIAAALAVVENALGKYRDAAEHFQFVLDNFPPVGDQTERARLQAGLDAARKNVGELKINVADGASVEVNGRLVGTAPLKGPVFVDPGQTTVSCKKKDFGEGKALVQVNIGEAKDVTVEIKITTGNGDPPGEKALWPFAVFGAVGAAGIGLGIAGIVVSQGATSDADEALGAVPDGGCGADGNQCASINDDLGKASTFLGVGIAGFAVAGAAGISALIYGLVPGEPGASEQAIRIVPVLGPTSGAFLEGRF